MEIGRGGTTLNPLTLFIKDAATSTTIIVDCRIPWGYPNTMVIPDVTFLWYDLLYSKAAVKRPLLVDYKIGSKL